MDAGAAYGLALDAASNQHFCDLYAMEQVDLLGKMDVFP